MLPAALGNYKRAQQAARSNEGKTFLTDAIGKLREEKGSNEKSPVGCAENKADPKKKIDSCPITLSDKETTKEDEERRAAKMCLFNEVLRQQAVRAC